MASLGSSVTGGMAGRVARPGRTATRVSVWARLGAGPWMAPRPRPQPSFPQRGVTVPRRATAQTAVQRRAPQAPIAPTTAPHAHDMLMEAGRMATLYQRGGPAALLAGDPTPVHHSGSGQRGTTGTGFSLYRRLAAPDFIPALAQGRVASLHVTSGDGDGRRVVTATSSPAPARERRAGKSPLLPGAAAPAFHPVDHQDRLAASALRPVTRCHVSTVQLSAGSTSQAVYQPAQQRQLSVLPYQRPGQRQLAALAASSASVPASVSHFGLSDQAGDSPHQSRAATICTIHFRLLDRPQEDLFSLDLPVDLTLTQFLQEIAGRIGLDDPARIRVRSGSLNGPLPEPFQYTASATLRSMLIISLKMKVPHFVYFEILEVQTVQVTFHTKMNRISTHEVSLYGDFSAKNVIQALLPKVSLTDPHANIRLLHVSGTNSFRVYNPDENVKFSDFTGQAPSLTLHAEEIPRGRDDALVDLFCIRKKRDGTVKNTQIFILAMNKDEKMTLQEIKSYLDDEFPEHHNSHSSFFYVSPRSSYQLLESDIVCDAVRGCISSAYPDYIQWEVIDSEESKPKRRREEAGESSLQKKSKAVQEPAQYEEGAPTEQSVQAAFESGGWRQGTNWEKGNHG